MKKKSIAKNAILSMAKTILSLIVPIITFPYISRILQVDEIGRYNFSASIISYFILIAGLGLSTYAIREGAKIRENTKKINQFGSEMYVINWISTFLAYILLLASVIFIPKLKNYEVIIFILSCQLALNVYGRSWVYNIFEEFGFITIVQVLFQIVSTVLLFILVHSPKDIYIYAIISVISSTGANLIYGLKSKKYVKIEKIKISNLKRHIKPILIIFSTSIATTIYVNSDMTILGWLIDDKSVGLYSTAVKIYNIVKQVIVAVITVTIPRLTMYVGNAKEFNNLFIKVFNILIILSLPAMVGLFCMSSNAIVMISGNAYIQATISLKWLSLALICALVACLFGTSILIPYNREKKFLKATIISASVNIVMNFMLIPTFKQNAVAFTTFISQLIAMIICYYHSKDIISLKETKKCIRDVIVGCIAIGISCFSIKLLNLSLYIETFLCVSISIFIYFVIQVLLKNTEIFILLSLVKKYLKKNKTRESITE